MTAREIDYTHGDSGNKPSVPLNFEQNERPDAQNFDWFWYNAIEAINNHAQKFTQLDTDDDGIVDGADGAATWSNGGSVAITRPTDINFTGDISVSDDGDGTATVTVSTKSDAEIRTAIDGADVDITGDADTVDGQHASAFAASGHNHDGTYVNSSGDTMSGVLGLGSNKLTGATDIDGGSGNHRLRMSSNSTRVEVTDQSNTLGKLGAADLYVGDGMGWLSNAITASGAQQAVDGSQHNHDGRYARLYDGVQAPVYASTADVPSGIGKGEVVYIDGDGLYVEDGT